ncbi:MAG TPA: tRNA pseudouridine(55) synthase TruB [Methylocella sp.]|nr:tRNA pseudouridine(55) synthase TruB [Methylocella sp.]
MKAATSNRKDVHGWVVLDKPAGLNSTKAVTLVKRVFAAKKAGHAGTLDPLATGLLPIALGEATKTVPFVQDGEKSYRFTVRWGTETDTDDADGAPLAQSEKRPKADEISALLPEFIGTIEQCPPAYSAIKINGERAYDLAREGAAPILAPRLVSIHALQLLSTDPDEAVFEARCGKGTYVRAIARDLGRRLGCYGHVSALRRTRVGPFYETDAVELAALDNPDLRAGALLRVEAGLGEVPRVTVDMSAAARLRRGQPLLLRGPNAPFSGSAYAACGGVVVAIGAVEKGELVPGRIFNLPY